MNAHAGGVAPVETPAVDLRPAIDKMETWGQGTRMAVLKALAAGKQDHEIKKECALNIEVPDYLERKIFREFGFADSLGHLRRKYAVDAYRAFLARPERVARPTYAVPHGEPAKPQPAAAPAEPRASEKPLMARRFTSSSSAAQATEAPRRKYFPPEDLAKGAGRISRLTDIERKVLEALVAHERMTKMSDALGMSMNVITGHLNAIYHKLGLRALDGTFEILEKNRDFAIQAHELLLARPELATAQPAPALSAPHKKEEEATAGTARHPEKPAVTASTRTKKATASSPSSTVVDPDWAATLAKHIPTLPKTLRETLLAVVRLGSTEAAMEDLGITRGALGQRMSTIYAQLKIGRDGNVNIPVRAALLKEAVRIHQESRMQVPASSGAAAEPTTTAPEPEEKEDQGNFLEQDLDRVAREIDSIMAPLQLFVLRAFANGMTLPELIEAPGGFSRGSIQAAASTLARKILSVPSSLTAEEARIFMGAAYLRSHTGSVDPNGRILITLEDAGTVSTFALLHPGAPSYEKKLEELLRAGYRAEVVVLVRRK